MEQQRENNHHDCMRVLKIFRYIGSGKHKFENFVYFEMCKLFKLHELNLHRSYHSENNLLLQTEFKIRF